MNILFCHGKEGSAEGTKAKSLKNIPNVGIIMIPKLTNSYGDHEFMKDFRLITELQKAEKADVIIGSSRGGALVCQMQTTRKKILIAPAWKKFKVIPRLTKDDVILHCKNDKLVPYEDSVQLVKMFGCKLIECGINHRMSDDKTLNIIKHTITEANNG